MKIGDKVRFLNEVGGGVVAGFADTQTALIRCDDGFEIPVLVRECVVIETDAYNIPRQQSTSTQPSVKPRSQVSAITSAEADERPITFRPRPLERQGADVLNLHLGFVPVNIRELSNTAFECYLINDSNYYIHYALLTHENATCMLRHEGVVEPNTKAFLEEFRRDVLPEWEKLTIQAFAYKQDKPFLPKAPVSVSLRPDCTKFYKLHTFTESDFFESPAYLITIVRNDRAERTAFTSAEEIKEAMQPKAHPEKSPARKPSTQSHKADEPIEVDLHADHILETTAGMSPRDILDYQLQLFHDTMKVHLHHPGRRIVFIHGKGEGVLRSAIIDKLRRHYKGCIHQDASFREYGFGATMVRIGGTANK